MAGSDLIKTVLGLDQAGPGDNGSYLQTLWNNFESTSASECYAAEESSLRWLLKSMNGNSPQAENLRRYPTAWKILARAFSTIPPVSLAKSLADRRFIIVLQQSLNDISSNVANNSAEKRRRKPRVASTFDLNLLRSRTGCLETGKQIFKALRKLLKRVDNINSLSSHDKKGAEHIKSFFRSPSQELVKLFVPGLALCDLFLAESEDQPEFNHHEHWIATLVKIWDWHTPSNEDATNVALFLFTPMINLRHELGRILEPAVLNMNPSRELMAKYWLRELESFLHQNLIFPTRAIFFQTRDLGALAMALDIAEGRIDKAGPGLYSLAASAYRQNIIVNRDDEWARQVFGAILGALKEHGNPEKFLIQILEEGCLRSMPIKIEDLRLICAQYGLRKDVINWQIVAACAKCDPGIFQTSDEGSKLRQLACDAVLQSNFTSEHLQPVMSTIQSIIDGFCTARNFGGFLKLWYRQVCSEEEETRDFSKSYWLRAALKAGQDDSFVLLHKYIEAHMSEKQLLELINGLTEKETHPQTLCILSSVIAEGVHSDSFVDALHASLFDLVRDIKQKRLGALASGLRWRTIAQTISWAGATHQRDDIWNYIHDSLKKVLRKSAVTSVEAFEAFKCCCRAWLSMYPDDIRISEPTDIITKFNKRIMEESSVSSNSQSFLFDQSGGDPGISGEVEFFHYLQWYLDGAGRLQRLQINDNNSPIFSILSAMFSSEGANPSTIMKICEYIIRNETLLNDFNMTKFIIDSQIYSFSEDSDAMPTMNKKLGCSLIILARVPLDCFTRAQRERIVGGLIKRQTSIFERTSAEFPSDELVLLFSSLLTRMLRQPTFNEEYDFQRLSLIADSMGRFYSNFQFPPLTRQDAAQELLDRFKRVAQGAIRQMSSKDLATEDDERSRSYFNQAAKNCQELIEKTESDRVHSSFAFHIVLTYVLATELVNSKNSNRAFLNKTHQAAMGAVNSIARRLFRQAIESPESLDQFSEMMNLFALIHIADLVPDLALDSGCSSQDIQAFILWSQSEEQTSDNYSKAWTIRAFLYNHLSTYLIDPTPRQFRLQGDSIQLKVPESLLEPCVLGILKNIPTAHQTMSYLDLLIQVYVKDHPSLEQLYAIRIILQALIASSFSETAEKQKLHGCLSITYGMLVAELRNPKSTEEFMLLTDILIIVLEKRQSIGQWNVENTLGTICKVVSSHDDKISYHHTTQYNRLCGLLQLILVAREHRRHLESRFHLVLSVLESLLRALVEHPRRIRGQDVSSTLTRSFEQTQDSGHQSQQFARLVTLICEPTAGAVSRSQTNSLDSDAATAKRDAAKHMYLLLMYYIKLQLEIPISRSTREILEPAMHSIFAITPAESGYRKILNDALDTNGRAILREMEKTFKSSGKWTGI